MRPSITTARLAIVPLESPLPPVATNCGIAEIARKVEDTPISDRLLKVDRDSLLLSSLFAALSHRTGHKDVHSSSSLTNVCLERWK